MTDTSTTKQRASALPQDPLAWMGLPTNAVPVDTNDEEHSPSDNAEVALSNDSAPTPTISDEQDEGFGFFAQDEEPVVAATSAQDNEDDGFG